MSKGFKALFQLGSSMVSPPHAKSTVPFGMVLFIFYDAVGNSMERSGVILSAEHKMFKGRISQEMRPFIIVLSQS